MLSIKGRIYDNVNLKITKMFHFRNRILKPADLAAYVGSIFLSSGGLYITVIFIHLHYGYSMDTNVDDIAVLKVGILKCLNSVY